MKLLSFLRPKPTPQRVSLRKQFAMLRTVLTQRVHAHLCPCGTAWLCTKAGCCDQPTVEALAVCAACEEKQMERWLLEYRGRQKARG